MTTKEYLNRSRLLAVEIEKMLAAGPWNDVQKSRDDVECKLNEWIVVKMQLVNAIYKLDDRRERIVLIDYYCERLTISQIASELGLSWQQTRRIKMAAEKNMRKVLRLE